ncbi:MAG: mechanosensitive ion channel family protein [Spirochaetes bacterium]|nr:mechanosensitive ion channel family protein [Spirochaetota bacterium]MBU0955190.1 mechanosensitive ion channel family protein [Spirochaetota bacterium]
MILTLIETIIRDLKVSEAIVLPLAVILASILIILLALIIYLAAILIVNKIVRRLVTKTKTSWDNTIFESRLFHRVAAALPWLILFLFSPLVLRDYASAAGFLIRVTRALFFAQLIMALTSLTDALNILYNQRDSSKRRPIKGYVQLVKIFLYAVAVIIVSTAVLNINPVAILSGLGAMSAVLMLVFKDSILGLVSSFQLSANDMVHIGDWVEMPKYGADGDVIDISLNTVKIRNWDMTITSIPIYAMISDSFKNWRGMSESGGRRMARELAIDSGSVRFCDQELLERFHAISVLHDYIEEKINEIEVYNSTRVHDKNDLVTPRRLTNIGTFRAYMQAYLKNHPDINQDMICMVRQLQATPQGIPLQVYAFIADKRWVEYERIQADIFDHFIAVLPLFDLRLYQQPSGWDWRHVGDAQSVSVKTGRGSTKPPKEFG